MDQKQILYLSRADVEQTALSMQAVLQLLENAFLEKSAGRVEMPAKIGIHPRQEAFSHAMPAYIPALDAAGVKWVSAYAGNNQLGLPSISGLIILNDAASGFPLAVMDATWITACRTGAASALSAKYLARPESSRVGILGCGAQGRSNLEALAVLFPIQQVLAYDINPQAQVSFIEETRSRYPFEIVGVQNAYQAVSVSDLVVTSGPILKDPNPTILKDWLKPGAFASSVDFASYWSKESLEQMNRIATDDRHHFDFYRSLGYFNSLPEPYADLGDLVSGRLAGRQHENERTLAVNLGLALEDIAVAPQIYRLAVDKGIGTWLMR